MRSGNRLSLATSEKNGSQKTDMKWSQYRRTSSIKESCKAIKENKANKSSGKNHYGWKSKPTNNKMV